MSDRALDIIDCGTEIDEGFILREIRKRQLDEQSKQLLLVAKNLIQEKTRLVWKNAQITVSGPALCLSFAAGKKLNRFEVFLNSDGTITSGPEKKKKEVQQISDNFEIVDCGAEIVEGSILCEIDKRSMDDLSNALLTAASNLIGGGDPTVWKNARIKVSGYNVRLLFIAGKPDNKFEVTVDRHGKITCGPERESEECEKKSEECKIIRCEGEITKGLILREMENHSHSEGDKHLLESAANDLSQEKCSVRKNAEIEVLGVDIHLMFISGDRSAQFQVYFDKHQEIQFKKKRGGFWSRFF